MGCITGNGFAICGNFAKLRRGRPKRGLFMKDHKCIIPYPDDWKRMTVKGVTCDCKEIEEHFQPWYGFTYYHSPNCAIMKMVKANKRLHYDKYRLMGISE